MNQPAPAWTSETAPDAMQSPGPPAPVAPAGFSMPVVPAASAPVMQSAPAVPLEQVMPSAPSFADFQQTDESAPPADPVAYAAPEPAAVIADAVPAQFEMPAQDMAFAPGETLPASGAAVVDPAGQWWSPAVALVLAFVALAWQLVSYYARVQLPVVETSGTQLTQFDRVVGALPLAGGTIGQMLGVLLAAGALGIILYGVRRGLQERQLQLIVGGVAGFALLLAPVLPFIAG